MGEVESTHSEIEEVVIHYRRRLEGRIKTFIEAITKDSAQCEARKDVVSSLLWHECGDLCSELEALVPKMAAASTRAQKGA